MILTLKQSGLLEYKKGFLMKIILPYDDASIDDIQLNSDIF